MLAALVLATVTSVSGNLATVRNGVAPPDFAILGQKGAVQHLSALRGKPVVLNFWASWCRPCTEELRYFTRARETYGDKIRIVTVSSEPPDVAASYLRMWNLPLPLVEDTSGGISRAYSVPPIPVTVVVDPAGLVSYVSVGELSWAELHGAIDAALGASDSPAGTRQPRVLR